MDAHGKGMEAHQNGKACWACPRSCWDRCHAAGRTFNPMPCVSSSQHQPPSQMGTRTCGNSVSICSPKWEVLTKHEIRWRYSLILAEDANFKQKARAWSNVNKDPPIGPGWGTFVENEAYLRHILTAPNKTELLHYVPTLLSVNSKTICRSLIVSGLQPCGTPIPRSQKDCEQRALVQLFVLVMQHTGQMGWVICKKANGARFYKCYPSKF